MSICGKPMLRYEPAGTSPALEDPACARPEGHNGPCRSAAALARKYRRDQARLRHARSIAGRWHGRPTAKDRPVPAWVRSAA